MLKLNWTITPSCKNEAAHINALCDLVFGPGRFAKTAFRVREAFSGCDDFGFCVWSGESLIGSITFTPIRIGGREGAYLLGPLVVHPSFSGQGFGVRLIEEGVQKALSDGGQLIILVGDLSYYGRMGFSVAPYGQFCFPGPVSSDRILVKELQSGAGQYFRGRVCA